MRTLRLAAFLFVICSGAVPLPGQCNGPRSVQLASYGKTCAFFSHHATLSGSYDPRVCTLTLHLTIARTCCNTFPVTQLLAAGATPITPGAPLPMLVPGCVLSVLPVFVFAQPVSAGGIWKIPLPPVTAPVTVYFQGIDHYFTTIGMTHDYQTSNGLRVVLR